MLLQRSHWPSRRWRHVVVTGWFVMLIVVGGLPPMATQAQTVVAAPTFSVARGFYSSSFPLTLSSATAGAAIRYTLDGSTPTPTSGTLYSGAITINKTLAVRAVAYVDATNKSTVVTHSYLFLEQVRSQPDTPPTGWPSFFAPNDSRGPYPADYGMDPDIINHANYNSKFNAAMHSLPTISLVTDLPYLWDANYGIYYNMEQKDGNPKSRPDPLNNKWERPVSVEWLKPDGSTAFTVDAGVRIHGQASRRPYRTPKKSLRLYFRSKYGVAPLTYPLFDFGTPVTTFDRLVIRNVGNRHWAYYDRDQRRETDYINDEWSRRTWLQMGHLSAHGTFAHVYLDGLYWGIYNVVERLDENFTSAYLGGAPADYDLISIEEDLGNIVVADAGTTDAYNALLNTLGGSGAVSDATYQSVQAQMDMVDFADYLLHTHYIGKTDWPYHNWNAYRKRVGPDTRFRWMTWDDDTGLNKVDQPFDKTNSPIDAAWSPSWMFVRLVTNAEFRQLLADRMFKHVVSADGVLAPANCAAIYSQLATIIDQAVIGESARWGDYSRDKYRWAEQAKSWPAYLYSRDLSPTDPINSTLNTGSLSTSNKKSWVTVRDQKLATYCPNRGNNLVSQYVAKGYYQTNVKPPTYSKLGGSVANGFVLSIANTPNSGAGDIYYTSDGSDPRATGGSIASTATLGGDSASVTISHNATVKARVKNGSVWSPLMDYSFTTSGASNQPPSVALVSPANGASFPVGSSVTIEATASDSDGTVSQVVITANGVAVCTDTSAPYQCTWTPGSAGNVSLSATATDNNGASGSAAAVNVTITGGSGSGAFLEQAGTLAIEAENFHNKIARSAHDWQSSSTPTGFSGAGALMALPNNGASLQSNIPTSSPELVYQATFSTLGTYNFWVRAVGPNGSDDSLHIGVDSVMRGSPAVSGAAWFWKKAGTATISTAGTHTIHIWMREDGTSIDKFLLTTASTTPTGTGPAESPRANAALEQMATSAETGGQAVASSQPTTITLPEVTLVVPTAQPLVANQPVTLTADFPVAAFDAEAGLDDAAWEMTFLANEVPIINCDPLALAAACVWMPAPGEYQLQVTAFNQGWEAFSTTEMVTVVEAAANPAPPDPVMGVQIFLPLIKSE